MSLDSNKKLLIIYILKILEDYSDENNMLSQSDIVKKIYERYGMECERKAVSRNIDSLIDAGFNIVKNPGGGVYLVREFEPSELAFIIDSIFSSHSIPTKLAEEMMEKLVGFVGIGNKNRFKYVYKANEVNRTPNKQIFYCLDIINEAIDKKRKIQFTYNKKEIGCQLSKRREEKYTVSPYFLINSRGLYYLVCNYEPYDELSNYRVDLITDVVISQEPLKEITELDNYKKGIDKAKYVNEHVYMFSGRTVNVRLRIHNKNVINDLVDWFGKSVKKIKTGGEEFVEVVANENAVFYWILQYGESVEVTEPLELCERVKKTLENMLKIYQC